MQLDNFIRPELVEQFAYCSAKKPKAGIRLHANESPWPGLDTGYAEQSWQLNRYPENATQALVERLSTMNQLMPEQCLITRGGDDAIDALMRLTIRPYQDAILLFPPTFVMYAVSAKLQGAKIIEVPLNQDDFSLNQEKVTQSMVQSVKLIFICRPNNPTGNCISLEQIELLCQRASATSLIVIDEAYIEFSHQESASCLLSQFDNLIVLKTLSKAYGLAGLRVGMVLANPQLITALSQVLPPYLMPTPVTELAYHALTNHDKFVQRVSDICYQREFMFEQLSKINGVRKVWPSESNFLLFRVDDATDVLNKLSQQGIYLRKISSQLLRVSVGLPEQNQQFVTQLETWCER